MGAVYKCEDCITSRMVAIKVLSTDRTDAKVLQRFQREAKAIARLDDPRLVRLFNVGVSSDSKPFIVMELVEGKAISEILATEGPMQEDRVKRIASQICTALDYAHRMGVVHRDLKPSNILLKRSDSGVEDVKIIDFGIAKVADNELIKATSTGELIGSPAYMSPEQVRGQEVNELTDQYSLGCVMFEMLTGQTPFAASTAIGVLMQHINDEPQSLSECMLGKKTFSSSIESVVKKLLQKDPKARFPSMSDCNLALLGKAPSADVEKIPVEENRLAITKKLFIVAIMNALLCLPLVVMHAPKPTILKAPAAASKAILPEESAKSGSQSNVQQQLSIDTNLKIQSLASTAQSEEITLPEAAFTAENVVPLSTMHHLKLFSIDKSNGADYAIERILHPPLQNLILRGSDPTMRSLHSLNQVPSLTRLTLKEIDIPKEVYDVIPRMPSLVFLDLNDSHTTDEEVKKLANMSKLMWLFLDGSSVNRGILSLKCPLQKLSLRNAPVDDFVIKTMNFPALTDLTFSGTTISDDALLSLRRFKRLNVVHLVHCPNISKHTIDQVRSKFLVVTGEGITSQDRLLQKNAGMFSLFDEGSSLDLKKQNPKAHLPLPK